MEGSAKLKVPGGKLLSVKVKYSSTIESIQLLGDFFLYPESSLQLIESALIGIEINSTQSQISSKVADVVSQNKIEMIGISPDSISQAILMAVKK
ncbi:MAG: hypothetical protein KGH71_05150 [Candidatus Micrarchaeota archaeon]|nr:hypothetical protein [Candidatus Micrarchaeota archaeon]